MNRLLFFLFATSLFVSCNNQSNNPTLQTISVDSAQKVFREIVVARPVFVAGFKDSSGRDFIVGIQEYKNPLINFLTNYILTRIVSVDNNWQIEKEDTIDNKDQVDILDSFKVEKIGNQHFISFTAKHFDPARLVENLASIEFHLIDATSFHDYSIACKGEIVQTSDSAESNIVSGKIYYDSLLTKNTELKKFQESKSRQSKFIYKKTPIDYDMNNVANYEKKWLIDNPGIEEREYVNDEPIKFTYYTKGLLNGLIDQYIFKDTAEDGTKIFQNSNYKIIVVWRQGVYAYDKKSQKQFPIWLYNCFQDADFDVELKTADIVSITNDFCNYEVTVNLDEKTYSRKNIK